MRTPTHITGGLFITGTLASFFNINIFAHISYLILITIFSILPDIDLRKSTIGRLLYPIAYLIDKRFGHRTITHSLLFVFLISCITIIILKIFLLPYTYLLLILFALFSHLILDMITIQGVPLFYPKRNPCVIPGNVDYRFNTSNSKADIFLSIIFTLLLFTFSNYFDKGFWTSYNRAFATITHVNRENLKLSNWLICEYKFISNNKIFSDSAYVIESSNDKLFLFRKDTGIFILDNTNSNLKIIYTKPAISKIPKILKDYQFFNISIDSLNQFLKNKIVTGIIQSNVNIKYYSNNIALHTNFIKLKNEFNFFIYSISKDSVNQDINSKIKMLETRLKASNLNSNNYNKKYDSLIQSKTNIINHLNNCTDLYIKNKLQNELIEIEKAIKNFNFQKNISENLIILQEIQLLKIQQNKSNQILLSGFLSYINL